MNDKKCPRVSGLPGDNCKSCGRIVTLRIVKNRRTNDPRLARHVYTHERLHVDVIRVNDDGTVTESEARTLDGNR